MCVDIHLALTVCKECFGLSDQGGSLQLGLYFKETAIPINVQYITLKLYVCKLDIYL